MTKEFRTLKDFGEEEIVSHGDSVYLEGIHYVVALFTITRREAKRDDLIFKILRIEDKKAFCEKHYGYHSDLSLHGFPHFNSGDYKAATKVIKALMEISEKQNGGIMGFLFPKKRKKKR